MEYWVLCWGRRLWSTGRGVGDGGRWVEICFKFSSGRDPVEYWMLCWRRRPWNIGWCVGNEGCGVLGAAWETEGVEYNETFKLSLGRVPVEHCAFCWRRRRRSIGRGVREGGS